MFLPVSSNLLWYCFIGIIFAEKGLSLGIAPRIRYPGGGGWGFPFYPGLGGAGGPLGIGGHLGAGGCPICDTSVYSYCSHKLLHDSCCCGDGYYTGNSFECEYSDCSFIHANSCRESELIANCCCNEPYKSYKPFFQNFYKK